MVNYYCNNISLSSHVPIKTKKPLLTDQRKMHNFTILYVKIDILVTEAIAGDYTYDLCLILDYTIDLRLILVSYTLMVCK